MSNRLGGLQGTAYLGTNANQPPNWQFSDRDPTQYDINYSLGDVWLNKLTEAKFVLVSLAGDSTSKGSLAEWVPWGATGTGLLTLTGNDGGGPITGDASENITLKSTIPGLEINGDLATHTLSFDAPGGGNLLTKLQGDAGTPVLADSNHIIHIESNVPTLEFTNVGAPDAYTLNLNFKGVHPNSIMQGLETDDLVVTYPNSSTGILRVNGGYNIATQRNPSDPESILIDLDGTTQYCVQAGSADNALYSIPNGSEGYVLTAHSGSYPTWESNSVAALSSFYAVNVGYQNNITGQGNPSNTAPNPAIQFTGVIYNYGSDYDGTSIYTTPYDGIYTFVSNLKINGLTSANDGLVTLMSVSSTYILQGQGGYFGAFREPVYNTMNSNNSWTLFLPAGEQIQIHLRCAYGASNSVGVESSDGTWFTGSLVLKT